MEAEAYMPVVLGEKTVECLLDSIQKKCSNFQPNTIGTIPSHFLAAKAYMAPWGGWGLRGCQSTSISPQLFTDVSKVEMAKILNLLKLKIFCETTITA